MATELVARVARVPGLGRGGRVGRFLRQRGVESEIAVACEGV